MFKKPGLSRVHFGEEKWSNIIVSGYVRACMSSHCILSRVCKWLLQFVATSFRDCFVLLFPGQLKCTCRQTCCKSGLSSHIRKVSPALCGIMATKNSLQELMLQVHCELQSYAVLCLAPCAVCHALRIYLEFVSFT